MSQSNGIILNHTQIIYKLTRLAWQVYENNMDESVLWIAGIDRRGMYIASKLAEELSKISKQDIRTVHVQLNENKSEPRFVSQYSEDQMANGVVILVDDVLNTGKTIITAMLPLIHLNVRKIQVLVLASRSHRLFPVKADFVGISMATTLQEHLNFDNSTESDLKLTMN